LPEVKYADKDAESLAQFIAAHLVSTDGTMTKLDSRQVLTGPRASAQSINEALDQLHALIHSKQMPLHEGDVVAVFIASHVLDHNGSSLVAATDTRIQDPPHPAISIQVVSDLLGKLSDYGCRVVLFLDGVHKLNQPLSSQIKSWVRELQQKRRVITFVASKEGASDVDDVKQHGLFALGLLQVFQGVNPAGSKARTETYTLDQFKTALREAVLNLSERRQEAFCYIPLQVPERTLFAKPQP
jgi:hypothetical protein